MGIYSLTWVFQALYHVVKKEERGMPQVASSITKYEPTGADEMTTVILTFPSGGAHGIATTNLRVRQYPKILFLQLLPISTFSRAELKHRDGGADTRILGFPQP